VIGVGRPESPLDPEGGPVQLLAYELRQLRQEAGGITYRVMAGRVDFSAATLSEAAAGERLPSLAVVLAYVQACGADSGEWEGRWRRAAEDEAGRPEEDEGATPPYRGLARFEPGDSGRFFGRDQLVADLAELALDNRFVAVVGTSGSGKSCCGPGWFRRCVARRGQVPARRPYASSRPASIRIAVMPGRSFLPRARGTGTPG
jgi:transcriptional regulator with XRE-family HTH domain